jgi:2'-5' RNA ligase
VAAQSAIIIRVAEAEPVIGSLREKFDHPVKLGVPAHITVLYPFEPPETIDDAILRRVQRAVSETKPFEFRLGTIGRFPGVLYLAPEPSAPFEELTARVTSEFPDFPPYEGQYESIIPHVTICFGDEGCAADAQVQLLARLDETGPVLCRCRSLSGFENSSGSWKEIYAIDLVAHD